MAVSTSQKAIDTPDELAVMDCTGSITWAELDELLNRFVNALLAEQVGDQRMAVFARNSAITAVAYLASLHAGVAAIPTNSHLVADELQYIIESGDARLIFAGAETVSTAIEVAGVLGNVKVIAWRCPPTRGAIAFEDWIAAASPDEPSPDIRPRPYLQFTSGTTGRPKAVEAVDSMMPRVDTVTELIERLRELLRYPMEGPHLVLGPLYHSAPLVSVRGLAAGLPIVIMDKFDAEQALDMIQRYSVASTTMVPTHFQRLLALSQDVRDRYDVSSLQKVLHTGASCPVPVKRAMIEWFGPIFYESYGGTETGAVNRINSVEWMKKPGSVGRTRPSFELLVIGENGQRLGPNQTGQLYYKDKSGRGIIYKDDPKKTADAHLEPGTFSLGDVGYYDEEGYVFITDRVVDMIISGGVNIYPAEIERVLTSHPDILDAAAVGAPNEEMGEEVKAIVVPRSPATLSEEDVLQFCKANLAGYKRPRSVEFVTAIERDALGKLNKRLLRAKYWQTTRTIAG